MFPIILSVFAITGLTPKFLIIQCCLHEKVHELLLLPCRVHRSILQSSIIDGYAALCIIVSVPVTMIYGYYQWPYKHTYWFWRTEHTAASQSAAPAWATKYAKPAKTDAKV